VAKPTQLCLFFLFSFFLFDESRLDSSKHAKFRLQGSLKSCRLAAGVRKKGRGAAGGGMLSQLKMDHACRKS